MYCVVYMTYLASFSSLLKYGGASSFKLLKTIVLDSMSINSLIVVRPSF